MTAEPEVPLAVRELRAGLRRLGWVTDLWVGGSLATGDHRAGVSDLDLVALSDGPVSGARRAAAAEVHRSLDADPASGAQLGCVYVPAEDLLGLAARHATWTHCRLVDRPLSAIGRAELVRHGFAVLGRSPADVLPGMTDDDVRRAARSELTGYWTLAARRPWWWLDPSLVDLGLLTMARARYTWRTGQLLTKTAAVDLVGAPAPLVADLRARRDGQQVRSPRVSSAWAAWSDARRTTRAAHEWRLP